MEKQMNPKKYLFHFVVFLKWIYIAQDGLKFLILLPQLSNNWDYRHVPRHVSFHS